ncbi:uncharacterized protein [Nicotiana sylvestris]|uniref:uncharacterized protein n=1 Tax=Nicotiana sylvestris TaxID=4096 RepID=UPI00388CE935
MADRTMKRHLGRPFLDTWKSLVDVEAGELTLWVGDEKVAFHVYKSMRQPNSNEVCSVVDFVTDVIVDDSSAIMNVEDKLEVVLLNLDDEEENNGYVECVNALQGMGSHTYEPRKLSLDLENRTTPPTKPSIEEPPTLELKPFPSHLRYEFLGPSSTLPVILSSFLTNMQVEFTLEVLQRRKRAIGWTLADIRGISLTFCMHKIILEEGAKPSIEHQIRLNEAMQEVVNKEITKWLDAGVVYPISDSSWASLVQCFPKKGGMTMVTNDKNELIPNRTVTRWRVCIDYRKLNKVTWKDHFPFHFLTKCLIGWSGMLFIAFWMDTSVITKSLLLLRTKRITTLPCPYGTFTFSQMPFGLCNAPATFKWCMMVIFTDIVEDILKVFMDDFFVVGNSFEECLNNLDRVLARCEETNLVLNWSGVEAKNQQNLYPVYYDSKIMNDAQVNYTVTEKDLLTIVFAKEKFRPYLIGAKRFKWRTTSYLEDEGRPHDGLEINDSFLEEQLLSISMSGMPWFADLANYLVSGIVPNQFSSNQRKKLK